MEILIEINVLQFSHDMGEANESKAQGIYEVIITLWDKFFKGFMLTSGSCRNINLRVVALLWVEEFFES